MKKKHHTKLIYLYLFHIELRLVCRNMLGLWPLKLSKWDFLRINMKHVLSLWTFAMLCDTEPDLEIEK